MNKNKNKTLFVFGALSTNAFKLPELLQSKKKCLIN